jgi:hypothetical protein
VPIIGLQRGHDEEEEIIVDATQDPQDEEEPHQEQEAIDPHILHEM